MDLPGAATDAGGSGDVALDVRPSITRAREIMTSAPHQPVIITSAGHARLTAELERLVAERPQLSAEIRYQRTDADNAAEHENMSTALAAQAALDRRIERLRSALATARIAAPPPDGVAALGQTVTIQLDGDPEATRYQLVSAVESDPSARRLSVDSPIGKALVGRRVGDVVEAAAPGGTRRVRVRAIEPTQCEVPRAAAA
jgi:transcription elongation factor GreA